MAAETIAEEPVSSGAAKKRTTRKKKTETTGAKKTASTSASNAKKKATARRSTRSKTASASALELTPQAVALPREVSGLFLVAVGLCTLLALVSFSPADLAAASSESVQNLIGPVGARVGDMLLTMFGLGAFCFNLVFWYAGLMLLLGRRFEWKPTEVAGLLLFVGSTTFLAHLAFTGKLFFGRLAGGVIGEFAAELARGMFGTVGASIIGGSLLLLSLMLATSLSLGALVRGVLSLVHRLGAYIKHRWRVHREFRARLAEERARLLAAEQGVDPTDVDALVEREASLAVTPIVEGDYGYEERFEEDVQEKLTARLGAMFRKLNAPAPRADDEAEEPAAKKARSSRRKRKAAATDSTEGADASTGDGAGDEERHEPRIVRHDAGLLGDDAASDADAAADAADAAAGEEEAQSEEKPKPRIRNRKKKGADDEAQAETPCESGACGVDGDGDGPRIVARANAVSSEELIEAASRGVLFQPEQRDDFELPSVSFLNYQENQDGAVDEETLREMAAQIEQTLRDFKVEGQVRDICPGPVITVFEFSPAPGVKISKISGLADDLAMALSALSVRIVAPIPGKGVVGIEVPNPGREMVYMKETLVHPAFSANKKMALPMALGKDTSGEVVVTDLAKMPHLLVAGATGSGKSVAVNTMITSLLYRHSPDDVRLIMVDPKMLEFSIYADIPHLLLPVVTDPREATSALNWAVNEMERRYQNLSDLHVRNIKGYNEKVATLTAQAEQDMAAGLEDTPAIRALGIDAEGKPSHAHLPYIVVIVDEFADLMMTASKDVETAVARLAQKARAAGIHLILATQRPSTDVVTGLIKANFPTRIALRVTSKTDSRVILDSNGAEALLGNGDMLFVPPGTSFVQRVHGAYVSEEEIDQVVDFLKSQRPPQYDETIVLSEPEEGDAPEGFGEEDKDQHYEEAVRIVIQSRQASISMIQRKLRVGYNRAARMVEFMEYEGIVAPPDGCRPREVLLEESPY